MANVGMRECDRNYRFSYWSHHNGAREGSHSDNFAINWHRHLNTYMFQSDATTTTCNNWRVQGLHYGNINVAFADGSVQSLSPGITHRELDSSVAVNYVTDNHIPRMGKENGVWDQLLIPFDNDL